MAFMRKAKIFKLSKGFYARNKNVYQLAKQGVQRALLNAYKDRKLKKRNFRSLWILRINAGTRNLGINYSNFMHGMALENIKINRKMLSELAVTEPYSFKSIVTTVKNRLESEKQEEQKKDSEFIQKVKVLFATHPPISPEVIKQANRLPNPPLSPKPEDIFY